MNYYELSTKRKSSRDFKTKEVSEELLNEIKEYYGNVKRLVPDIQTKLMLIDPKTSPRLSGCAGYKDYLIEAPAYMLILSEVKENYMLNAGYVGEDMVLKLTEMGLSSCWVTINDADKLKERLFIEGEMEPVALVAFGYEKATVSLNRLDIINISNVELKKRSGYEAPKLFIDDAIISEDMGMKENPDILQLNKALYRSLVAACCSPSFLNKQPYRFIIKKGVLTLLGMEDKDTGVKDYELNLGILMLNFYGTVSTVSNYAPWKIGTPEGVEIPEGYKAFAYINV